MFDQLVDFPLYQTKSAYGLHWLKIFHQNSKRCYFVHSNENFSYEDGCYSILSSIDESFKINDAYEFLLEYPDNQNSGNKNYNHWRQTNFPLDETTKLLKNVTGFEPIHISWWEVEGLPEYRFNGLSLSNNIYSIIDGCSAPSDTIWFFAIGVRKVDTSDKNGRIPGYNWKNTEVELWLRIKNRDLPLNQNPQKITVAVLMALLLQ